MRRVLITLFAFIIVVLFVGCNNSNNSNTSYSKSQSFYQDNDNSIATSSNQDNAIPVETHYTLTKDNAIAILTDKNKIWHNVNIRPDVGTAFENYYVFINKDDYVEGEWHYSGEAEVMFTLSFDTDSSGNLKLIYDGGSAYRQGTYQLADNYFDGMNSQNWYLDEDSFTFDNYTLTCKTYD